MSGTVGGDEKLRVRVPAFVPLVGETLIQLTVGVETVHLTVPFPDLLTVTVTGGIELPEKAVTFTGFGVTSSAWAEAETGKMRAHNNSPNKRTLKAEIRMDAPCRMTKACISAPAGRTVNYCETVGIQVYVQHRPREK